MPVTFASSPVQSTASSRNAAHVAAAQHVPPQSPASWAVAIRSAVNVASAAALSENGRATPLSSPRGPSGTPVEEAVNVATGVALLQSAVADLPDDPPPFVRFSGEANEVIRDAVREEDGTEAAISRVQPVSAFCEVLCRAAEHATAEGQPRACALWGTYAHLVAHSAPSHSLEAAESSMRFVPPLGTTSVDADGQPVPFDEVVLHTYRAAAFARLSHYDDAQHAITRAVALSPRNPGSSCITLAKRQAEVTAAAIAAHRCDWPAVLELAAPHAHTSCAASLLLATAASASSVDGLRAAIRVLEFAAPLFPEDPAIPAALAAALADSPAAPVATEPMVNTGVSKSAVGAARARLLAVSSFSVGEGSSTASEKCSTSSDGNVLVGCDTLDDEAHDILRAATQSISAATRRAAAAAIAATVLSCSPGLAGRYASEVNAIVCAALPTSDALPVARAALLHARAMVTDCCVSSEPFEDQATQRLSLLRGAVSTAPRYAPALLALGESLVETVLYTLDIPEQVSCSTKQQLLAESRAVFRHCADVSFPASSVHTAAIAGLAQCDSVAASASGATMTVDQAAEAALALVSAAEGASKGPLIPAELLLILCV